MLRQMEIRNLMPIIALTFSSLPFLGLLTLLHYLLSFTMVLIVVLMEVSLVKPSMMLLWLSEGNNDT